MATPFQTDSMHNSWRNLIETLLTPRKIAWVLVVAGIAYFIYTCPKTPVEFFDANTRDEAAIQELKVKRNKATDPTVAEASRRIDYLMLCQRRMDRIALLYDITNNPQSELDPKI